MADFTLEQKRAIAIAEATARARAKAPAERNVQAPQPNFPFVENFKPQQIEQTPSPVRLREPVSTMTEQQFMGTPRQGSEAISRFLEESSTELGEGQKMVSRIAPPIITSMVMLPRATGPVGFGLSMAASGVAGALGSVFAGDEPADIGQNAVLSSYSGIGRVAPAAYGVWRTLGTEALKETAGMGATITAASTVKRSIEAGELTAPDLAAMDYAFMGGFGLFGGTLRGMGARSMAYQNKNMEVRKALEQLNFMQGDLPPGLVDPSKVSMDAFMANADPAYAQYINKLQSTIGAQADAILSPGQVAKASEVAEKLNVYLDAWGDATTRTRALQSEYDQLTGQIQQLERSSAREAGAARAEAEKAIEAARTRAYEIMAEKAQQRGVASMYGNLIEQQTGFTRPPAEILSEFSENVGTFLTARGKLAGEAYKKTGVDTAAAVIDAEQLAESVLAEMNRRGKSPLNQKIYNQIREVAGRTEDGALLPLSIDDVRNLRANMASEAQAGSQAASQFEAAANRAYFAATDFVNKTINDIYGTSVGAEFKKVNAWWAETANAMQSRYAKNFFLKEPGKNELGTLVNDLMEGRTQGYKDFLRFIDSVSSLDQAGGISNQGRAAVHSAVRDQLISTNLQELGGIDFRNMTKQLAKMARYEGFDVAQLGFGSSKQIREVLGTFEDFNRLNSSAGLNADSLIRFYDNPHVKAVMGTGGSVRDLAGVYAAKEAFENVAVSNAALRAIDPSNRLGLQETTYMRSMAKRAQIGLDEQQEILRQAQNHPVYQALSGRPLEGGVNAVSDWLQLLPRRKIGAVMGFLNKENPSLAREVKTQVLSDLLEHKGAARGTVGETWRLDAHKVREFLDPANRDNQKSAFNVVASVVGEAEAMQLRRTLPAIQRISDWQAGLAGAGYRLDQDAAAVLGVGSAAALGRIGGTKGFIALWDTIMKFPARRQYAFLSALSSNGGFKKFVYDFAADNVGTPEFNRAWLLYRYGSGEELGREVEEVMGKNPVVPRPSREQRRY
jgi:hypothetical protein